VAERVGVGNCFVPHWVATLLKHVAIAQHKLKQDLDKKLLRPLDSKRDPTFAEVLGKSWLPHFRLLAKSGDVIEIPQVCVPTLKMDNFAEYMTTSESILRARKGRGHELKAIADGGPDPDSVFECEGEENSLLSQPRLFLRITHVNPGKHKVQYRRAFEGKNLGSTEVCFAPLTCMSTIGHGSTVVSTSPKSVGPAVLSNLHLHIEKLVDADMELQAWKRGSIEYTLEDAPDACRNVVTTLVMHSCSAEASARTFTGVDLEALGTLCKLGYVAHCVGDAEKWYFLPDARSAVLFGNVLESIPQCAAFVQVLTPRLFRI